MNKEVVITQILHSVESTKNFISTNCNSLKEYLVKENMEQKMNGCGIRFGTKCSKCVFILLNVFYLITALLILTVGATGQFAYLFYGLKFEFNLLSISWIVSGVVLLLVSIFGIIGACKNSVALTNLYGVLMIMAFVVQLATSIVGFTLISKSESIARHTLNRLMDTYGYSEPSMITMDYFQKTLQCCGVEGPNDWMSHWKYSYNNGYSDVATDLPPSIRTPATCCTPGSGYQNLKCDTYFQKGCLGKVYEITLQLVLMIDSVALAVAVVQIIGIVIAFVIAKMIRRTKSYEQVHKCKLQSDDTINDRPTFVDYTQLDNNE